MSWGAHGGCRGVEAAVLVEALVLDRDGRVLHDLSAIWSGERRGLRFSSRERRIAEHGAPVAGVDHPVRRRALLEQASRFWHVLGDRGRRSRRTRRRSRAPARAVRRRPARPARRRGRCRLRRCRRRETEGRRRPGGGIGVSRSGWARRGRSAGQAGDESNRSSVRDSFAPRASRLSSPP